MQQGRKIFQTAGQIAGKRQVRYGTNALVMTVALIAILVFINILAERNHKRWDLTSNQAFSLSQQTIQIINGLKQPVQITGFFVKNDKSTQQDVESRLKEYTSRSNLISYRFIDPNTDPVAARNYNITSSGTLVFESNGRRQQATGTDEQAITGALLKITQDKQTTVYFLTGHQERSIDGAQQNDYSDVRQALEQDNFRVAPINLTITTTIPLSNTVLVVADPQEPLQEREEQAISTYVAQGGRLMVLGNPLSPAPLSGVLKAAGLTWNDDVLIDQQSEIGNPTAPAVIQYPSNEITKDLNGRATLFPTVRTIQADQSPPSGVTLTPLLQSSPGSQAATDFKSGQVRPSPNDKRGPLTFGYTAEGTISATGAVTGTKTTNSPARLVVIGDADFAANADLSTTQANSPFFRNAIAWLAQQDQLISIPAKTPEDRSIFLTDSQGKLLFFGCAVGLPLLVLALGVGMWWRRR